MVEITQAAFSAYQITPNIVGRSDDWFVYPHQAEVHPMTFWNLFEEEPLISEYQVEQTKEGAIIRLLAYEGLNIEKMKATLETALQQLGLTHPKLAFERVKTITRHQETGKLRRFIPLSL